MSLLTNEDIERIAAWRADLTRELSLELIITQDERSRDMERFCDDLAGLVPNLGIKKTRDNDEPLPRIRVQERLSYLAVPTGFELGPFLSALRQIYESSSVVAAELEPKMTALKAPASLQLYISAHCPQCPSVVTQVIPLALNSPWIRLDIIDGTLFQESARAANIRSAPTLVSDGLRWTGAIRVGEVLDVIANRDPMLLSADSLRQWIHDGDASGVARMILENGKIIPSFFELLIHEKWPVRLGAMVVLEEIIEIRRPLAAQLLEPILSQLDNLPETVQGDLAYILGEIGDDRALPRLADIRNSAQNADLQSIAREAMDRISAKQSIRVQTDNA